MKKILTMLVMLGISACHEKPKPKQSILLDSKIKIETSPLSNTSFSSLKLIHTNGPIRTIHHEIYLAKKIENKYVKVALGNRNESSFDPKGNITKKLFFNSNKKLQVSTQYIQDAEGKITQVNLMNAQGKPIRTISLNYNQNAYLDNEEYKTTDGKIEHRVYYKWSNQNECIETIKKDIANKIVLDTRYVLNEFGSPIMANYNYNNRKPSIDCKTKYETLDVYQNWTQAFETSSKGSIFIHERMITYYPSSRL
jgi:hypothetical protein